jgi:serine/threonine protein kinase
LSVKDFEPIKIIGRGAYGEVRLCKWLSNNEQLVAIKKMKKKDVIKKNEIEHIKAERTILSKSANKWIIDLYCSFQDEDSLYLVMEYMPGGDLMNMLIKKDIFSIEEARFYIAEIILAVEYVHSLGFVHRDIKPDNILLDKDGHIKVTDFGLCTNMVPCAYFSSEAMEKSGAHREATKRITTKRLSRATDRTERRCTLWLVRRTISLPKSSTRTDTQRSLIGGPSEPFFSRCLSVTRHSVRIIRRRLVEKSYSGANISRSLQTSRYHETQ